MPLNLSQGEPHSALGKPLLSTTPTEIQCKSAFFNSHLRLKVIRDNPKPSWGAAASPESLLCCSVRVCRQVSSPVSLWSSGRASGMWWSYWRRRWTSPRSCRYSSEYADICRTPYAPGEKVCIYKSSGKEKTIKLPCTI